MACTLHVAWDERLAEYDFGPGHPLAPVRVELTMALARAFGLLEAAGVSVAAPEPASEAELEFVHDRSYIAAVRRAPPTCRSALARRTTRSSPACTRPPRWSPGATVAAARAVWSRGRSTAANVAGGLHHAMRGAASGFCVYNDPAIAIKWLLAQGAERIAYVDLDVHHGDGVQAAFYDDPRVLTISLHEHPRTLFPGTGLPATRAGAAPGYGRQRGPARWDR